MNRVQLGNTLRQRLTVKAPRLAYRPRKLSLYITSRCNLAYNMCGYHMREASAPYRMDTYPDMTLERCRHIMSLLPETVAVTLTGEGEPFLNENIYAMAHYIRHELGLPVDSSTNGIRLDPARIINCGLQHLNISVDGTNPQEYATVRGGPSKHFEKVVQNVRDLVTYRNRVGAALTISISFIVSKTNYRSIDRMMAFGAKLGIDSIEFQNNMDFATDFARANPPIFDTDTEILDFLKTRRKPAGVPQVTLPVIFRARPLENAQHPACNYPFNCIGVNTNGGVNPCCYLNTAEVYGNLFTQADFWNNAAFQGIRQKFLDGQMPFELCRTCPTLGFSSGVLE